MVLYSCKIYVLFVNGFQIHAGSAIHGDPVHSWRPLDAGCYVFCYICLGKEVCAAQFIHFYFLLLFYFLCVVSGETKLHMIQSLLSVASASVLTRFVDFYIVLFHAAFPTGTLLKCHWICRLHTVRARAVHRLCCCTLRKLIWWKNWLLKELKRNRFVNYLAMKRVWYNRIKTCFSSFYLVRKAKRFDRLNASL